MNEESDKEKPFQAMTFEEIFKQNERRIHYHIHRMGIRDPYREFYTEGVYALWQAYNKYNPNKGPLATYFNYNIRNRLIDQMRKENRIQEKDAAVVENKKQEVEGTHTQLVRPDAETPGQKLEERQMWEEVREKLTENQWNWVYYYIIQGLAVKEIAAMKGVTDEAVKSWGKEARKKLRRDRGGTEGQVPCPKKMERRECASKKRL